MCRGKTRAEEQRDFRSTHLVRLRVGSPADKSSAPRLPGNKAAHPVFGGPSVSSKGDEKLAAA